MKVIKITTFIIISTIAILVPKELFASEGTVEIASTTNENNRCFAASLLMQDLNYTIIVSCRDLIYPAETDVFNYVLWAQPLGDSKPTKLGTLDFGKKQFRSKNAFSSLFITTEQNPGVRSPTGKTVMQGDIRTIDFLEGPQPKATLTPEETKTEPEADEADTKSQTKELSTKDKLVLALRRAGIAALLAFIALLGLIFVITRSRT